jgi:hypothetical protein
MQLWVRLSWRTIDFKIKFSVAPTALGFIDDKVQSRASGTGALNFKSGER